MNGTVTAKATVDENGFASGAGEYRGVDGCVARVALERYDGKSRERAKSPEPPAGYDGAYAVDIIRTGDNFRIASMRLSRENGALKLLSADNRSHGSAGMESTFRGNLGDDGRFRVAVDISYLNRTYRRAHVYGSTQLPSPFAVGRSARFRGPTLGGEYGSEIVVRRIR